jgi:serine/threonine protein kinase
MTELFGLKGNDLFTFKVQSIACCDLDIFKLKKSEALEYLIKYCKNLVFDEFKPKMMVDSFYSMNQDILFGQEHLPTDFLKPLPPFSEFGRKNFTNFLEAWVSGKEMALVPAFWKVYSSNWKNIKMNLKPLEEKLFLLRRAAFDKYQTVQFANSLIDSKGLKAAAKLSTEEFLENLEIRINREGLTENELVGLVTCSVCCGEWETVGLNRIEALEGIKDFCKYTNSSTQPEDAVKRVFNLTQNGLMAFRKDDFYTLQKEPPFSDFGFNNLVEFLTAYRNGGEELLEEIFNEIFCEGWKEKVPEQPIIRILRGDGRTKESAIKFSISEIVKRVRAEFWYVYYQFGKGWEHMHSTALGDDGKTYSCWILDLQDGANKTIYFDTNREEDFKEPSSNNRQKPQFLDSYPKREDFQVGDIIIGEFRVLDIFGGKGKSGMGVVYLVEQREYPFPIVLKTFQKNDEISTSRFRVEAETWISIGIHPNIVQAYFVREINEQLFIAAEYIATDEYERNTVTDYIKQGKISNFNAVKWTAQFCYAMDFALTKGLRAHRDIKPDNLMIDNLGNLKVTDFGLSKAFTDFKLQNNHLKISKPDLTSEGSFIGTLLFASPEQIVNSSTIDYRSDIYSFGIVLYQIISSGGFPYSLKGKTTEEDIALIHFEEQLIEIEHPLFPIVEKCLAKNPKDRYQTFNEFLNHLERISEKLDIKLPINNSKPDDRLRELYIQSLSFLELGDTEKSLEIINQYLEYDQSDSSSWQLKGRILAESGEIEEGIKATLKSYALDPYNSRTLNNLGIFYNSIGEQEKAVKFLMKAIEVDSHNAGAVMNLAIVLENRGSHTAAAHTVLAALDLAPDKKSLRINAEAIAKSTFEKRVYEKSIQILERLIKLDRDNIQYWIELATVYQAANQKEKAIKCNEVILDRIPNDEDSLLCLATLNAEIGNYNEALKYCEIMLDKKIALSKAISFKAQIMQTKGQGRDAIDLIRNVLNSGHQNNDNLWILLGTLYENEKIYAAAKKCFLQAKSILSTRKNINQENLEYLNHKISRLEFFETFTPEEIMKMINKDTE